MERSAILLHKGFAIAISIFGGCFACIVTLVCNFARPEAEHNTRSVTERSTQTALSTAARAVGSCGYAHPKKRVGCGMRELL